VALCERITGARFQVTLEGHGAPFVTESDNDIDSHGRPDAVWEQRPAL
jgi:hypothetical protein